MAQGRHKRDANARSTRPPKAFKTPAAFAATALTTTAIAVGVGLGSSSSPIADPATTRAAQTPQPIVEPPSKAQRAVALHRADLLSRSAGSRVGKVELILAKTKQAVAAADQVRWTTTSVVRWTRPDSEGVKVGSLAAGAQVKLTGREFAGRTEIAIGKRAWWIAPGQLTSVKPIIAASGLSMEPCPNPSVENGLTQGAVYVYRSVCHAFPQITSYGGWDNHGEHVTGKAIDIMTSDVTLGTAIAQFLEQHSAELNLYDIIWRQHIYMPMRAGDGWRAMASRGSITANHYDHVHVSVN